MCYIILVPNLIFPLGNAYYNICIYYYYLSDDGDCGIFEWRETPWDNGNFESNWKLISAGGVDFLNIKSGGAATNNVIH